MLGYNYKSISEKVLNICKYRYRYFFNKQNVQGISLGYKLQKGYYKQELCLVVSVSKKVKYSELQLKDRVPLMYEGIKTDVVESGEFRTYSLKDRIRPVLGGYSIGPAPTEITPVETAGSMGCLVKDSQNNYILSGSHVLSLYGYVPMGTYILQPGNKDGGSIASDVVAALYKYIPVQDEPHTNYLDCALAIVLDKKTVSNKIALIGAPKGADIPKIGEVTKKVGRVTGFTTGKVKQIGATAKIQHIDAITGTVKELIFKNQIITNKMAEAGDSGSALLNMSNKVIGLCMAGSETFSIYNPIEKVLNSLGVEMVIE